jgi:hypothetical protein
MTLLGQAVGTCEACGKPVLSTEPRVSAHGPIDARQFIGGGEFDALLKQSGYAPDGRYGHGGEWAEPRLLHLDCAPSSERAGRSGG